MISSSKINYKSNSCIVPVIWPSALPIFLVPVEYKWNIIILPSLCSIAGGCYFSGWKLSPPPTFCFILRCCCPTDCIAILHNIFALSSFYTKKLESIINNFYLPNEWWISACLPLWLVLYEVVNLFQLYIYPKLYSLPRCFVP